jgi:hypothetical protein
MQAKTKKIIIASSIIGAIAIVAGYIIVRRRKRTQLEQSILAGSPNLTSDETVGKLIEWPLKYGSGYLSDSERASVRTVQAYLNKKMNENNVYALSPLIVDGHFGGATETALIKITGVKQVSYTLFNNMEAEVRNTFGMGTFLNNLFSYKPDDIE